MKTNELVTLLARGAGPVSRALPMRDLAAALAIGLIASAAGALVALGPFPTSLWSAPAPWIKLAYAAALIGGCAALSWRLASPGAPVAGAVAIVAAAVGAAAFAGLSVLASAPASERAALIVGNSALRCPWIILVLSLPALAGVLRALRLLAPTRLTLSGFVAGLLGGAVGAAGYALSCDETAIPFIAIWYSAGILLSGALGAVLGPRALRW